MNFEIQTSSYFDAEAKRLAKRHRSFIDDLQDFRDSCGNRVISPGKNLIAVLCHYGNLRVEYRNVGDALTSMNRRIGYQTIYNHSCVICHVLQVLVDGHGILP